MTTRISKNNRISTADAQRAAAKIAAAHAARGRAIARATANMYLSGSRWRWDGERLVVPSASTKGVSYIVTRSSCPCDAGRKQELCWHRLAWEMYEAAQNAAAEKAAKRAAPPAPRQFTDEEVAAAQAAVDEFFN